MHQDKWIKSPKLGDPEEVNNWLNQLVDIPGLVRVLDWQVGIYGFPHWHIVYARVLVDVGLQETEILPIVKKAE